MDFILTENQIEIFIRKLQEKEKSLATIKKYTRDVRKLQKYLKGRFVTKDELIEFKKVLTEKYRISSVNSIISAVNMFAKIMGLPDCQIGHIKEQRKLFYPKDQELCKTDFKLLLAAAWRKKDKRLYYILVAIAGTGIRISELKFFTVKAIKRGKIEIKNKGKVRTIVISNEVKNFLLEYCRTKNILFGPIFVTKTGNPVDRVSVWRDMKKLCEETGVDPEKVFPHSLRRFFARIFYNEKKIS